MQALAFPKSCSSSKNNKQIKNECTRVWREIVFKRDNYQCQWCNSRFDLTAHHIVPRSVSNILGYYDPKNGMTLCFNCHLTRMVYKPKEYLIFRNSWLRARSISHLDLLFEFRRVIHESEIDFDEILIKLKNTVCY
jgi:hypothetical protein